MAHRERRVRIQLEVPLSMVARADALHRARARSPEPVAPSNKQDLYLEALERGLAILEAGDDEVVTAVTRIDRRASKDG